MLPLQVESSTEIAAEHNNHGDVKRQIPDDATEMCITKFLQYEAAQKT